MTRKLEELFDLDPAEEKKETKIEVSAEDIPKIETMIENVDKIDAALPTVSDLQTSDNEKDDLAQAARDTFKDLMDLGMNVEARFSGEIFNNASRMLDTALSAKQHKVNKKLRMVDLQIKKATLDSREARYRIERGEEETSGDGHVIDRSELLREILGKNDKKE